MQHNYEEDSRHQSEALALKLGWLALHAGVYRMALPPVWDWVVLIL